jgi:probable poly-beta-1,6-N-acetyl-D-glucosamine export protein
MYRRLLYLNGLAIFAVVLYHAGAYGFIAMFAWSHQYLPANVPASSQFGNLSYYILRWIQQICEFAIPAFLVVTGYSITTAVSRNRNTVSWKVIISRIKSLLIPYLIWSAAVIFINVIQGQAYPPDRLLRMFLEGSTNEVLYFVPLLIQFYLLSPLLILWVKKSWKSVLIITLLVQLFVYIIRYPFLLGIDNIISQQLVVLIHKRFFIYRVFWFPLGIIIGFHFTEFKNWLSPRKWIFVMIALIAIVIGMVEFEVYFRLSGQEWLAFYETIFDAVYGIALIVSVLTFDFKDLPLSDTVSNLGTKSYGIYLTHAIFIENTARVIYHLAPEFLANQLLLTLLLVVVGLGTPLGLMFIINRSPARIQYNYLFG